MKMDSRQAAGLVATLLLPPFLYILSSGPVLRFAYREKERFVPLGKFYTPLFRGAEATHLAAPLNLYLQAWDVMVGTSSKSDHMYVISEDASRKATTAAKAGPTPKPAE